MRTAQEVAALRPDPTQARLDRATRLVRVITTDLAPARAREGHHSLKCRVPANLAPLVLEQLRALGYDTTQWQWQGKPTGRIELEWPRAGSDRSLPRLPLSFQPVDPARPPFIDALLDFLRRRRWIAPDEYVPVEARCR